MPTSADKITARNEELGAILREARTKRGLKQAECARHIGTSRQRYGQLEAGRLPIPVAEYEALLSFLHVPFSRVWPDPLGSVSPTHEIAITVAPGDTVNVILRTSSEDIDKHLK